MERLIEIRAIPDSRQITGIVLSYGNEAVLEAARMTALSVVDVPAYSESVIQREARAFEGLFPRRRPKVWL